MAKLGDIDPQTGRIFWSNNHGWLTPEVFSGYRASQKRAADRFKENHPDYSSMQEAKHRDKNVERRRTYYEKNKDLVKSRAAAWSLENPAAKRRIVLRSMKKQYDSNPTYRVRVLARNRIQCVLRRRGIKTRKNTLEWIGCSSSQLRDHLERQFQPGMTWENIGIKGWHVDHKIPLASAQTLEEIKALCHYTNLQPMWWMDNILKGAKIIQ